VAEVPFLKESELAEAIPKGISGKHNHKQRQWQRHKRHLSDSFRNGLGNFRPIILHSTCI
jgi:hypothetical protein